MAGRGQRLEHAPHVADDDLAYCASDTTSLHASLLEGMIEYGRRYHKYKAGQYCVPDDEIEANRLDLQHHLWLKTLNGKLYLAPLQKEKVKHVLDMGTGTGIWAIAFADRFPLAEVIGVDLSPCQPSFVPLNCRFEVDDCEDDWIYQHKFNYIHGRVLIGAFQDWPKVIKQAYDGLAPGGWLELHEILYPPASNDGTLDNTALAKWSMCLIEAAKKMGRPIDVARRLKQWMIDAGFQDVTEIRKAWPQNPWPKGRELKELGHWTMTSVLDGLEGFSTFLMNKGLGWTQDEINYFLTDVRKDVQNTSIHSFWPLFCVYGRKPE